MYTGQEVKDNLQKCTNKNRWALTIATPIKLEKRCGLGHQNVPKQASCQTNWF